MAPDTESNEQTPRIILGIDPGLETTGYAVLESSRNHIRVLEAGILTTKRSELLPARLLDLFVGLEDIIDQFSPCKMAVEQLFSHYGHPKTAITMGHARGVLFLAAARKQIPVASYLTTKVKHKKQIDEIPKRSRSKMNGVMNYTKNTEVSFVDLKLQERSKLREL